MQKHCVYGNLIVQLFACAFQEKMDQLLQMIQSADPTDNQSDPVELLQLEGKTKRLKAQNGEF